MEETKMITNKTELCLMCKKEPQSTRGLCYRHYAGTLRYVREGKASWEQLEKTQKTLPPINRTQALKQYLGI